MGVEHLLDPLFLFNPSCSSSSRSLLRGGDLAGGGSSGGQLQRGRGRGGQEKGKKGATTRVLWEKETTPQMSPDFASNGPQPFPSSTHQRSTFGQHFFGILHKSGHLIAKCLYSSESDRDKDKKGKKKEKKRYYKKGGEAHMGREWDSDESSTDSSSDEDAAIIAVNKELLFPNVGHKCLMAKDGKKRRYTLEPHPNILHLVMRVVLVKTKMI
jgi:hypothetical protein